MTSITRQTRRKVPGVCVLIHRICRVPAGCTTWEYKLGFFCLISNIPIGIGGAAVCILLNTITDRPMFLLLGTIIYAISWLMLFLGIFLTGKHFAEQIRRNTRIKYKAWKKFRKKLRQNCAIQQ